MKLFVIIALLLGATCQAQIPFFDKDKDEQNNNFSEARVVLFENMSMPEAKIDVSLSPDSVRVLEVLGVTKLRKKYLKYKNIKYLNLYFYPKTKKARLRLGKRLNKFENLESLTVAFSPGSGRPGDWLCIEANGMETLKRFSCEAPINEHTFRFFWSCPNIETLSVNNWDLLDRLGNEVPLYSKSKIKSLHMSIDIPNWIPLDSLPKLENLSIDFLGENSLFRLNLRRIKQLYIGGELASMDRKEALKLLSYKNQLEVLGFDQFEGNEVPVETKKLIEGFEHLKVLWVTAICYDRIKILQDAFPHLRIIVKTYYLPCDGHPRMRQYNVKKLHMPGAR